MTESPCSTSKRTKRQNQVVITTTSIRMKGHKVMPSSASVEITPSIKIDKIAEPERSSRVSRTLKEHEINALRAQESLGKGKLIFHPESNARFTWDILTGITTIMLAWRIPYLLGFDAYLTDESTGWKMLDTITDIIYIVDIVMNFRTGFVHDVHIVMEPKLIALNYAKGYLILDLVGSIPFELLYVESDGLNRKAIKATLKYLKIPKLFRLARLVKLIKKYIQFMYSAQVMLGYISLMHWTACIWAGLFGHLQPNLSPKDAYGLHLYESVLMLLNIGPVDTRVPDQKLWAAFFSISGAVMLATAIGSTTAIILTTSSRTVEYQNRIKTVMGDLEALSVPKDLRQRTKAYYDMIWRIRRTSDRYEQTIYQDEDLSPALRSEIAMHIHRDLITTVPLFRDCSDNCLATVVMKLKTHLYLKDDVVFFRGEPGTCMMIISKGSVYIKGRDETTNVAILTPGCFFGEMGLLSNTTRTCTVTAAGFCELKSLGQVDAVDIFLLYPTLKERLEVEARLRSTTNHHKAGKDTLSSSGEGGDGIEEDELEGVFDNIHSVNVKTLVVPKLGSEEQKNLIPDTRARRASLQVLASGPSLTGPQRFTGAGMRRSFSGPDQPPVAEQMPMVIHEAMSSSSRRVVHVKDDLVVQIESLRSMIETLARAQALQMRSNVARMEEEQEYQHCVRELVKVGKSSERRRDDDNSILESAEEVDSDDADL